jgi:cephalosporin-C deacetylase-like acetyl esterase
MTVSPIRLCIVALSIALLPVHAQQIVATPYSKTGIYRINETVGWTVGVAAGEHVAAGAYTYTVTENGQREIRSGTIDLAHGSTKIEATLGEPGMVRVEIRPPAGTKNFGDEHTGGPGLVAFAAAVDPMNIKPSAPRPADFDEFWKSRLDRLAKVPMNAVVTLKESGVEGVNYATFRLDNAGGAHVYGQMAWPERAGKFPALAIFQWARPPYPLEKPWVTDRAREGWLAVNVEPHDVPSDMPQAFYDALPQMLKEYQRINDDDRDHNYFLQMYLGDYRAVEFIATRPEWDGRAIVATGISMGGQQSLVTAALNPRITGVVVNVPAGADAAAALHGRDAGYPFWDTTNPRVVETAAYFDVVNFAPRIHVPSMLAMGFLDKVAPSIGIWTAFNQIAGPKEAVPMIDSPHNHQATPDQLMPFTTRSAAWLTALLHGEPAPVRPLK